MQLSILFIAERLRVLPTTQLHSVNTSTSPAPARDSSSLGCQVVRLQ